MLYLYGEVNFTDAFGCLRWMTYKFVLGGPDAGQFPGIAPAADGNETSDESAEDCVFKAPHQ